MRIGALGYHPAVADGIDRFWTWWSEARHRLAALIAKGDGGRTMVDEISAHVDAIADDLQWELGPGKTSKHAISVTGYGNPELRVVTETWRLRGPAPDATWEYYPALQVNVAGALEIHDLRFEQDELVVSFEVDDTRERVHATFFHAHFPQMEEGARSRTGYLLVDQTFGEDNVERWFGGIEIAAERPEDARPIADLKAAVEELARSATGEKFAILRGQDDAGNPVFRTMNFAIKRIDHLLYTMHVAIDLAIVDPNPHGLTTNEDAERLNAIEDALTAALGATAVYLGRETRRGRRVLHWYAPEDGPAAGVIERWSADHPARDVRVAWTRDVRWTAARELRGG